MKAILKTVLIIVIAFVLYWISFWMELDYPDKQIIYNLLRCIGHFVLIIPINNYFKLKEKVK